MKKDKEIMSGVVKAGPKPRWTIMIKDNEKGNVDVHDTNVLIGAFKPLIEDGFYKCKFIDNCYQEDINATIATALTAIREICSQLGFNNAYKKILEVALEDLEKQKGDTTWSN